MKELLKAKSKFRKLGVTLMADKTKAGGGGSWKFASEDNLVKTIQKPLTDCGLEVITTMKFIAELSVDTIEVTLFHCESGESISSSLSIPAITPKKDRNGNPLYLDAEIERGKQFGYWSRILTMRILGLSDVEDMENSLSNISDEEISRQKIEEERKLCANEIAKIHKESLDDNGTPTENTSKIIALIEQAKKDKKDDKGKRIETISLLPIEDLKTLLEDVKNV